MTTRVTWNASSAAHGIWTGRTKQGHAARIVRSAFGSASFVGHVTLKGEAERPMVVSGRKSLPEAKRAVAEYINKHIES